MENQQTAPSTDSAIRTTPLDQVHRDAGATMVPFAGYDMPVRYSSIIAEHQTTRSAASLFDVSHMGRLRFEGSGAGELLDHLCTRQVSDMPAGGVRYGLMCNADGGTLDDVLVTHVETPSSKRYFLVVVNAANHAKILNWITPHLADFPTVTVTDRTELTAMIAVQGPRAMDVCARLFAFDPKRLKYYRAKVTEQMGKPVLISRTGYTGEDGFELIVRAEDAARVWENLLLVGRDEAFAPAGLAARDTLRLEAAMPLYGHELTESIDPITAGLKFAVDLQDRVSGEPRSFIGDEAIRDLANSKPAKVRVGLLLDGRRPAREGSVVRDADGSDIGMVTSGGPSPTLNRPIAMAYVDRTAVSETAADPAAAASTQWSIDIRGKSAPAIRTPLPFYRRPSGL